MAYDLIMTNANLHGRMVDVLVKDGKIAAVNDHTPDACADAAEVHDAQGKLLFPSFVDTHVHLREPGFEYKEDVASGLTAAAHGGFGHVMPMANTSPVNDSSNVTELMLSRAAENWPNGPFVHPVGALSKKLEGKELAPMAELAQAGCAAFSNDGLPIENAEFFRRAVEYAADLGRTVIDHCEDPHLAPHAGMNEGVVSSRLGLRGAPWVGEAAQISRDILLAEYLGVRIHLAHVSCKAGIELIRWAKSRGVQISAETCPHYLFLTENEVLGYNTNAKVNPPLRTEEDVHAMREAIADGTIDCLCTDHAPHAAHEKEVEFMFAPCGISGLDTAVALTYDLVRGGQITSEQFVELWCTRPAGLFNIAVNTFAPGDPAEFFLFDPEQEWIVGPETMHSKGKNTPLTDKTMKGLVIHHWMNGVKIV